MALHQTGNKSWPEPMLTVLETKAGPSVWDRQLLVKTSKFLHISLQIDVWISQNSDRDRQLFQLSLNTECWSSYMTSYDVSGS